MNVLLSLLITLPAIAAGANKTLWKEWYVYSVNGKPQGYFEETMEKRPDDKQLAVTQRWVEKEDGRTETYIGSVATDDDRLAPVAFFSERKGPNTVYKIDGRAKDGALKMTFKAEKPKAADKKKAVVIGKDMVLSNFVPSLLARHDGAKAKFEFSAVVEDARDGKFDSRSGQAEIFGVKKKVKGQSCRRAMVNFAGVEGEWWFTKEGKLCELTISANGSKLVLASEEEAKKSL